MDLVEPMPVEADCAIRFCAASQDKRARADRGEVPVSEIDDAVVIYELYPWQRLPHSTATSFLTVGTTLVKSSSLV